MTVEVWTQRTATGTSTGEQSFTTIGKPTPVAMLIEVTAATSADTITAGLSLSYGAATSAANSWSVASVAQDNQETTNTYCYWQTGKCISILDTAGALDAEATFVSFTSGGMSINFNSAPAASYMMTITFFSGTDVTATATSQQMGNTHPETVSVTGLGVRPDLVATCMTRFGPGVIQANGYHSRGFVHEDGAGTVTQRSFGWNSRDNRASGDPVVRLQDNAAAVQLLASGVSDWHADFENFGADGFDILTRNAAANNQYVLFLSLDFNGAVSTAVFDFNHPNNTDGAFSVTSPGIEPQYVTFVTSNHTVYGTSQNGNQAGMIGQVYIDADNQHHAVYTDEDAAPTSNTSSTLNDSAMAQLVDDQSVNYTASFTAFTATGFDLNYTASEASPPLNFGMAIGAFTATANAGPLVDAIRLKSKVHGALVR